MMVLSFQEVKSSSRLSAVNAEVSWQMPFQNSCASLRLLEGPVDAPVLLELPVELAPEEELEDVSKEKLGSL